MTSRIKEIFQTGQPDQSVTVQGWVRTKRELKEFTFLEVNDGSSLANLQVILEPTLPDYENVLKAISTGAAIAVSGNLVPSPGKGQNIELKAAEITLYGDCPADYPLQKKRHSFEFLRTIAHLRARTNTLGAVMRVRNACATAIHTFFQEKSFIWVHTPIITANDCEGAGELFTVTSLDLKKPANFAEDFFGKRAYLTVSGQLQAEVMAMALSNVYTFGPTFRAENSNTSRHLAEFWMVEPEMAFCDLEGDQDLAEAFLKYIFKFVLENCPEDLQFFNERIDKTVLSTAENIVNSEFGRITYSEAIELLEKADRQFEFPVEWGLDLQSEHERYLAEELFKKPVIVTNYPKTIKAFYMRLDDNNKTVSAMDILAPKIGEIIGGSQREERLDVLIQRMQEQGMNPDDLWWYLDLRRYGSVPHAGFGLGFERLVQFMTGMTNIRDVIPFPRTPLSADF
ncbi:MULTISPECIES: asparagine--tRNA ligase [unclassified Microcystis]|jgi:asparaginyl-tRNA synthetase|uniref:Asparagine--tRNA ligase n=1 Tax=Microcystis flos-aquae Mf_QC_C_20070823_S10D TaxID=2486236 RepID=A0A552KXF9_9CHRO|nr:MULTISPECIES: asparagine--tRNA ligase [unclassified Microcystis]MCA2818784.1 asparagine--tRNA ligase [Microcystis sp. M085S1]MCA2856206.1 asparagine--tRNA ligase [Microcystis sp. M065S1]TRU02834.1 MAG: asparagine--tRNA ligase [Microcystis flos-aquae Ma_QC_C_20070823_S18D]TRV12666.1 MAG: asparagine--tRNA ligase [Microcystis flos-aquae Mf_QC_C_20070823_S10D]TRV27542.1 MAG: asparagine--tRNA ligase [Microcystis flos-aquae Mf_QC_C_20070823_S10]TRV32996.1 MAG: asparagine--tRNA ligase [Microcysti